MRPFDPRLLRHAAPVVGYLGRSGVFALTRTACTVLFAWLVTRLIVGAISGEDLAAMGGTLLALAATVAVRSAVVWLAGSDAARSAAAVKSELRANYLRAVVRLGPGANPVGVVTTAGEGLEALDAYFAKYLPQLVGTAVVTPVLVIAMFWQDVVSGIILVVTLPLIPLFMALVGWATRSVQQRQWDSLTRLSRNFLDVVGGLATLKIFGRQHRQATRIAAITEGYRADTMRVLKVSFLSGFVLEVAASLAVAIVAVTVGLRLLSGSMDLTAGLFVLLLAPEAFLPIRAVGAQFHAAADGAAASVEVLDTIERAERLDAIEPSSVLPASPRPTVTAIGGGKALVFDGVTLRRGERTILEDAGLRFEPGELTVVAGESGAGKSSLFAAVLGFAAAEGGIAVGAALGADARRRRIAWAPQHPSLVAGTVAENVALGAGRDAADSFLAGAAVSPADPAAAVSSAEAAVAGTAVSSANAAGLALVRRALAIAAAGELAADAPVTALSGGQAARVAIARAVYRALDRDCPVLLLDEPSAALDEATEARLIQGLRELADEGRTVVVASHRPAVIAAADALVRLELPVPGAASTWGVSADRSASSASADPSPASGGDRAVDAGELAHV